MLEVFYTCFHYCISVSMARCNLRPPIVLKCFISRPVVIRDLTYNSYDPYRKFYSIMNNISTISPFDLTVCN